MERIELDLPTCGPTFPQNAMHHIFMTGTIIYLINGLSVKRLVGLVQGFQYQSNNIYETNCPKLRVTYNSHFEQFDLLSHAKDFNCKWHP